VKLPWREKSNKELRQRVQELEQELENLREEKKSLEDRYEAEKDRRSKLAAEKQEKDEKLKKMRQRLETEEASAEVEEESGIELKNLEFEEAADLVKALSTLESPRENLVTVKIGEEVRELEDFKGLRNTLDKSVLERLYGMEHSILFHHPVAVDLLLRTRGFLEPGWNLENYFSAVELLDFINSRKTWVVIAAGSTTILEEENGEIFDRTEIKSRVDRKHTQGGYSQSRFERKREEQVDEHLDQVREELPGQYLVVGNRQLASKLEGDYLGGFDDNRPLVDELDKFRAARFD
jgi:hypothetical protein